MFASGSHLEKLQPCIELKTHFDIGYCRYWQLLLCISRDHENNLILLRKSDLHYPTNVNCYVTYFQTVCHASYITGSNRCINCDVN